MKRIFAVLLALSLLLLAACSKGVSPTEPSQTEVCAAIGFFYMRDDPPAAAFLK